jgi:small-conductance mechanosensitive channel
METWTEQLRTFELAGNDLLSWALALVVACVVYLALAVLVRLLKSRLGRLAEKTRTIADDLVAGALQATKRLTLVVAAAWGGALLLELGAAGRVLDLALIIVLTLQAAIWANRAVSIYIRHYTDARREADPGSVLAVQGLSFIARLAIWSVALLLAVENLGYDVTALVAGLGIGGIAIALAVQNVLGDLFASLSIILDKPFVIGDFIIVDDLLGVVEKIGIKTTRLRSLSGEQLVFANSDLLSSRIRNYKRMYERRVPFSFGVVYRTAPDQLEAIPPLVRGIIEGIGQTRFDRAHFKGFGDSSLDFEVVYYVLTPDYNVYMDIQQEINLAICRAFAERGIDFAYPTRTLYIEGEGRS